MDAGTADGTVLTLREYLEIELQQVLERNLYIYLHSPALLDLVVSDTRSRPPRRQRERSS